MPEVYRAVRNLRFVLSQFPETANHEVPDVLTKGSIWLQ